MKEWKFHFHIIWLPHHSQSLIRLVFGFLQCGQVSGMIACELLDAIVSIIELLSTLWLTKGSDKPSFFLKIYDEINKDEDVNERKIIKPSQADSPNEGLKIL